MAREQELHVTTTKTPGGWKLELDHDTWVLLLDAVNLAITGAVMEGRGEEQRVRQFRT